MRWVGLVAFLFACHGSKPTYVSKTHATAVTGGVFTGTKTSLSMEGGAVDARGRVVALVCVEGTGTALPSGESLVVINPDGSIGAHLSTGRCGAQLVSAGAQLVVVHHTSGDDSTMRWQRFDAELRPLGRGERPMPGGLLTLAGRDDGAVFMATIAGGVSFPSRVEIAILGQDMATTQSWTLSGDFWITNLVADGAGVLAVGDVYGTGTIGDAHSITVPQESLLVAHLGPDGIWSRTIGANGVTITAYERPNLVKVGSDIVVTWNAVSVGNRLPAPDYDRLGGMPPVGYYTFFARLDATGAIVSGHREESARHAGALSFTALASGELLEHRVRATDAYEIATCRDEHGCDDDGGPEAHGRIDTLVIRRRAVPSFEILEQQDLGGSMVIGGTVVRPTSDGIVVAGSFAGTLRLPGLTRTTPQSRASDCEDFSVTRSDRGLFASSPPPDPCEVTVTRHSGLFVTRLD